MVDGPRGWGKHIDWGDHGTSGWNDKYGGSGGGGKGKASARELGIMIKCSKDNGVRVGEMLKLKDVATRVRLEAMDITMCLEKVGETMVSV